MNKLTKTGKVTFNKSGSGSTSAKIIIPSDILKLMGINEENRDIEITYYKGQLIIKKVNQLE